LFDITRRRVADSRNNWAKTCRSTIGRGLSLAFVFMQLISLVSFAEEKEPHWAAPMQKYLTQSNGILKNWQLPSYVGTVLESSKSGTIGNPPSSQIEFQQTLRGAPLSGSRHVVWTRVTTVISAIDPACNTKPYDPKRECTYEPHKPTLAESIDPPTPGEKIIIFTLSPEAVTRSISVQSAIPGIAELLLKENSLAGFMAYPASVENLANFERYALQEERFARRNMGQLFLVVLVASAATIILAFFAPKTSLGVGVLMFFMYSIYESGIDVQENIRVDMIIIYPALIFGAVAMLVSMIRIMKKVANKVSAPDDP
jgi:hypothetical protein